MARQRRRNARHSCASIYSHETTLPPRFCELARLVERQVKAPLWLLVQNYPPEELYSEISFPVYKGFQKELAAADLPAAALLIESPGGNPEYAYRIARAFQRRARRFTVIVPQFAKSAATLLALGANELILGRDAELGPLDIQLFDFREERYDSALNAVQALERLNAYALTAFDQTMMLLMKRLRKRSDVLVPLALNYVATLMKPLLEKVDTVDYSRKSRDLKVAEEYAARLMRQAYGFEKGKELARRLVQNYPAHGFVIDREEILAEPNEQDAENTYGLGLKARSAEQPLQLLLDEMIPFLDSLTAVGKIAEVNNG